MNETKTNVDPEIPSNEAVSNENPTETPELNEIEQIKLEMKQLRSTNQRLLEESKKYKEQKRTTEFKLLEAEGKKDEIIQTLQKDLEDKQARLHEHEQKAIEQIIASKVANKAKQYGCDDWDQLLMLGKSEFIEYDPESGDVKGIDLFFEDALRNDRFKKFFLKTEKVKTSNQIPSMAPNDWKKNPLAHLMTLKKEGRFDEYKKAYAELERDGLLK